MGKCSQCSRWVVKIVWVSSPDRDKRFFCSPKYVCVAYCICVFVSGTSMLHLLLPYCFLHVSVAVKVVN